MKIITSMILVACTVFLFVDCKKAESGGTKGIISFVNGNVFIQRGGQKIKTAASQELQAGDILITEAKSTATVIFGESASILEIQSNSEFHFKEIGNDKVFSQGKGSSWIFANKLAKGEKLSLQTPTTTAGVRGTKFYTGVYDDMTFTCHCEGQIELENTEAHSKKINESDYLAVTKGDKTVYITPKDLQKVNIAYVHNHSEIQGSPVGEQNKMTPEEMQIMFDLVQKKLAAK